MLDLQRVSTASPVHFVGVGGCGMSGLALTLHHRGYRVSGSDRAESANVLALRRSGVPVTLGHRSEGLPADAGLIVVSTAAIAPDVPDLVAGRRRGVPVVDRAELLAALMAQHRVGIAVAGTRGKTTTASLLGWILESVGLDPGLSVGSAVRPVAGNYRLGAGPHFVAEACEYHRAFWHLHAQVAVVLNIAEDHSDCFTDLADTQAAFRGFAERIDPAGLLVAAEGTVAALEGVGPARRVSFALGAGAAAASGESGMHYAAQIIDWSAGRAHLSVFLDGRQLGMLTPRLPGQHNAHNVLAAVAAGHQLGLELSAMREPIEAFAGAPRRLQVRYTTDGVRVVDDIACHPGEIAATMDAVRRMAAGGRVVVVLRPNSFTRVRDYLHDYAEAFTADESVLVTDIYPGRDTATHGVHAHDLVHALRVGGRDAHYLPDDRQMNGHVLGMLAAPDTLVTIGPGDTGPVFVPALSRPGPESLKENL